MKILIAEDNQLDRHYLQGALEKWGYDYIACRDGKEAWQVLEQGQDPPQLAILDWVMPGLNGIELCQKIRQAKNLKTIYVIILTAMDRAEDLLKGFEAGADDYLTKPFNQDELYARLKVGIRIVELQNSLAERVEQLEESLSRVTQLQGLLPICTYCKKIRNDKNYWEQVEDYFSGHSEARFSHGICPKCYKKYFKEKKDNAEEEKPADVHQRVEMPE